MGTEDPSNPGCFMLTREHEKSNSDSYHHHPPQLSPNKRRRGGNEAGEQREVTFSVKMRDNDTLHRSARNTQRARRSQRDEAPASSNEKGFMFVCNRRTLRESFAK